MNINLTPEQEEIVRNELKLGRFQTAEGVISQALKALHVRDRCLTGSEEGEEQRRAASEMLDFVDKNRTLLQGISVKQLIHEGHRW
jgi:hypothetical protein